MLVTTYQHDYVLPHTNLYEFCKNKEQADAKFGNCQGYTSDIPKTMQKHPNVEWTGVAPMGRLIDPRIIPTKLCNEQLDAIKSEAEKNCFIEQPNRFLKILQATYPDLYERLKHMPDDELNRRFERDRMHTTYQIDYCDINEYPEGIYKSLKLEDETTKLNTSKLMHRKEACADLRTNVIEKLFNAKDNDRLNSSDNSCEKAYKPFQISFADSNRFVNSGNNSHWRSNIFTKRAKVSEYMDTISKIGCVITKNNIHDHQKCTESNCKHQLVHTCANLK